MIFDQFARERDQNNMSLNDKLCYGEEFNISSPFICIDNYLLCCEWKASNFVPKMIIQLSDLKAKIYETLSDTKKKTCESPLRMRSLSERRGSDSNIFAKEARKQSKQERNGRRKHKSWDGNDYWQKCFALNTTEHDAVLIEKNATSPKTTKKQSALEENSINKHREYTRSVSFICSDCEDYINTESVDKIEDLLMLIEIIMSSKTPAMFMVRLSSAKDISITYQFLPRFKQDYMMVPVNPKYCILMKTF